MPIPSQRKFDLTHGTNRAKYVRDVRQAYLAVINALSKLSVGVSLNANDEFYFRNYSDLNNKVNALLKTMNIEVYGTTVSGINTEWGLGVDKNNDLAEYAFGDKLKDLPKEYREKYLSTNGAARRNFLYRKDGGLTISQKVWNNTRQLKQELELALELGIGSGKSAASIAKDIKKYLNDPDMLFRRVRDKEGGALRLSKAASAVNPGRGKYRSSYKNAVRLVRNEVNFAYEGSQYEKRKQQDFIVGLRIKVSPGHDPGDDKGGISCLELQGDYPKGYDWTYKWHVNCLCLSLNILKTREELDIDTDRILRGEAPTDTSVNAVGVAPSNYTRYIDNNKGKWANWKNPPRFIQNN